MSVWVALVNSTFLSSEIAFVIIGLSGSQDKVGVYFQRNHNDGTELKNNNSSNFSLNISLKTDDTWMCAVTMCALSVLCLDRTEKAIVWETCSQHWI